LPTLYERKFKSMLLFLQDYLLRELTNCSASKNTFRLRSWDCAGESFQPTPANSPRVVEPAEITNEWSRKIWFMYDEVVGTAHGANFDKYSTYAAKRCICEDATLLTGGRANLPPSVAP
jgi:hypothetical protein